MKLADVRTEFEKYIIIRDRYALEMVLGTLIGNSLLPRDPLWTMIVAPSSGGKSTLLAPAAAINIVHFLDDLTEKTFLSGYKVKGKEVSLLKIIGSGVLCFSDFTSILSKNPNSKAEVLGQLRLVYDGTFSKRTGTGEVKWAGKIGVIGACTPDIYFALETARSMGERFLYYTLEQPTDEEIVKKQEDVKMSSKDIAEAMKPFYSDYYESVSAFVGKHGIPELVMTTEQLQRMHAAAIFCVAAKATIHLDFKTSKPDAIVNRPGVGRDRKMFNTLLQALQLMNCHEADDPKAPVADWMVELVEKCAYSSVSRERRKILEILSAYGTKKSATEIGATDNFGLQKEGVEKYLYALNAAGLIQKDTSSSTHRWYIEDQKTQNFVLGVSGVARIDNLARDMEIVRQAEIDDFDTAVAEDDTVTVN
jgi:Fe2+ or Zn2+ uptake regulation protein